MSELLAAAVKVSAGTIYQALYVQGRGALRDELKVDKALRSGRRQRIPQTKLPVTTTRPWLIGHELSKRPAEDADRALPGHWEGELVLGARHKTALITLVEHTGRFTLIRQLPHDHGSTTVTDHRIDVAASIPTNLHKTLTLDQRWQNTPDSPWPPTPRCSSATFTRPDCGDQTRTPTA